MTQSFLGIQVADVGQMWLGTAPGAADEELGPLLSEFRELSGVQNAEAVFVSQDTARLMEQFVQVRAIDRLTEGSHRDDLTRLNIGALPVVGRGDVTRPAQPIQGRAGPGLLPGARNREQPIREPAGMLGHHRVEKSRAEQAPGGHRLRVARRSAQAGKTSVASQASGSGRRSAHTDHPAGFGCTICSVSGHNEVDCAKPVSKGNDSTFCPYHRSISGVESHAGSNCHQIVDQCWEAMVDDKGHVLSRVAIDREVTHFVRDHRGGRPEPRCGSVHSHWAMCVARYIKEHGAEGIDASTLPVRRVEIRRRQLAGELQWQHFDHGNVQASRNQFLDAHWDSANAQELEEKLRDYARNERYLKPAARRERRGNRDAEQGETGEEAQSENGGADAGSGDGQAKDGAGDTLMGGSNPHDGDPGESSRVHDSNDAGTGSNLVGNQPEVDAPENGENGGSRSPSAYPDMNAVTALTKSGVSWADDDDIDPPPSEDDDYFDER